MLMSVLIPTYRRPHDLKRCLNALKQQTRQPDEVIVVVRDTDHETWALLAVFDAAPLCLRALSVHSTGVVAALNLGLSHVHGDIVSITDDDAAPRPDWLARIEQHFLANPSLGGVGGRDWIHPQGKGGKTTADPIVGRVQWVGRVVGNHHLGVGEPRPVDILKGVNMSYRRSAIASLQFDERMRGTGAQVHFEMAFSLVLKKTGWTLIYDPAVAVDHYPAQRFDEDQRHQFDRQAQINQVHNETLTLLEHLPPIRRIVFLLWSIVIGTRNQRGLIQCLRFLPQEHLLSVQKYFASLQGRWQGWQTWQQSRLIPLQAPQKVVP